jgi:hypothetical protein
VSIALESKVEQLLKRVEALERAQARALRGLSVQNSIRKAEGTRLRTAIGAIVKAHPEYTAKHVLRALPLSELGRSELPSVRAIQWHMQAVRNAIH